MFAVAAAIVADPAIAVAQSPRVGPAARVATGRQRTFVVEGVGALRRFGGRGPRAVRRRPLGTSESHAVLDTAIGMTLASPPLTVTGLVRAASRAARADGV